MTSPYVWQPNKDFLQNSNLSVFMRKYGIQDYDALCRRSVTDPAWFWELAAQDLGIRWMQRYDSVLDMDRGLAWAKWFPGGRLNLVDNVVDQHTRGSRRNKCAYIWEGEDGAVRRFTYGELQAEVNRAANALRSLGVKMGDRVAVFMPVLPETLVAALATIKLGAIIVPLFSGFSGMALAARIRDAEAKVVITADGFYRRGKSITMKDRLDEVLSGTTSVQHVLVVSRLGTEVKWQNGRDLWWHETVAKQSDVAETVPVDPNAPACISYTSGTTGTPKGAVLTHIGLLLMGAKEVRHLFDYRDGEVFFWVTDWGWAVLPLWVMSGVGQAGGTSVIFEGAPDWPGPDRFWRMIKDYKVNIFGVSATAVRVLARHGDEWVRRHDLSSLRVLGSTGEPWNEVPWLWYFNAVGGGRCPIVNVSGGTEVTGCFVGPTVLQPLKPCTVGGPLPGMAVDVVDEEGQSLDRGLGYLVCRQPWPGMTQGLWGAPERYIETYWSRYEGVWFHADWVQIDADGYWYILGRADDTLKLSGRRMGPAEFESALVADPAVSEAAAVGVPDPVKGEAVVCFVVLRPGMEPGPELATRLQNQVANNLGTTARPREVHFVKDLPRTRSAKIVRRAIRARYLGQSAVGDLSVIENPEALQGIPQATEASR